MQGHGRSFYGTRNLRTEEDEDSVPPHGTCPVSSETKRKQRWWWVYPTEKDRHNMESITIRREDGLRTMNVAFAVRVYSWRTPCCTFRPRPSTQSRNLRSRSQKLLVVVGLPMAAGGLEMSPSVWWDRHCGIRFRAHLKGVTLCISSKETWKHTGLFLTTYGPWLTVSKLDYLKKKFFMIIIFFVVHRFEQILHDAL